MGEIRNPSDPESYELDPKRLDKSSSSPLRLKFRVQQSTFALSAVATSCRYSAASIFNENLCADNLSHLSIEDGLLQDAKTSVDQDQLPGWDAILWKGRLYVSVTAQQLSAGSKEAFVDLLEYAEDVLECSHVIVCLGKPGQKIHIKNKSNNNNGNDNDNDNNDKTADIAINKSTMKKLQEDKDVRTAIRNFLFLGFQPLAPGHEFTPSDPNLVCFVYTI